MPKTSVLRPDDLKTKAIPIHCLRPAALGAFLKTRDAAQRLSLEVSGFKADPGAMALLMGAQGLEGVVFGLGEDDGYDPFLPGKLASLLPAGTYRFAAAPERADLAALSFVLETYRFTRYRNTPAKQWPTLLYGKPDACAACLAQAEAMCLARDLITTPANDLGPEELAGSADALAKSFKATCTVTSGKALEKGFPLIHAVGQASPRAPRLIDLQWGKASHKKVTLVGKGVVFDTGGLDIKPSSGMLMMKKDMGGAASVLALAHMVMAARLPVRLRVLIPAVENSVSGSSFRPGDVIKSRKGLTVEIGNTDAEGRLVLADALDLAVDDKPDLLIDMATLTGAARVALGLEVPAFFTDDEQLAQEVYAAASAVCDPLWRMPLHKNYKSLLKSKIADLNNVSAAPYGGAITAALFLQAFTGTTRWMHIDSFGWNNSSTPGHPEGGEALGARALFAMLAMRYGQGA